MEEEILGFRKRMREKATYLMLYFE